MTLPYRAHTICLLNVNLLHQLQKKKTAHRRSFLVIR